MCLYEKEITNETAEVCPEQTIIEHANTLLLKLGQVKKYIDKNIALL